MTRALCAEACIDGGVPGWWLDATSNRWFLDVPAGDEDWCTTVEPVEDVCGRRDIGWRWEVVRDLCGAADVVAEGRARLAILAMGEARIAFRGVQAERR